MLFTTYAAFWLFPMWYHCSRTYKSDHDLFCKLCAPTHALNHLLPPTRRTRDIHTSWQNILKIFIRNLFLSVLCIALSSEIVFFRFCCFVLYVQSYWLLFVFVVWCAFVASNKYYMHTYYQDNILNLSTRYDTRAVNSFTGTSLSTYWHSWNILCTCLFIVIFANMYNLGVICSISKNVIVASCRLLTSQKCRVSCS